MVKDGRLNGNASRKRKREDHSWLSSDEDSVDEPMKSDQKELDGKSVTSDNEKFRAQQTVKQSVLDVDDIFGHDTSEDEKDTVHSGGTSPTRPRSHSIESEDS